MKWITILSVLLFPIIGFSQAQVTGGYSISGNFTIGTNVVDQTIQSLKVNNGLIAAHLGGYGMIQGDSPTNCATWFDLTGNGFNWTSVSVGTTNQPPMGLAGTNQVGTVGIMSLSFSTNIDNQLRMECNSLAPIFNIPNTGIPTNGGITVITLTRPRLVVRGTAFALAANAGNGNANTIADVATRASATQRSWSFGSTTNTSMVDITVAGGVVTNRWSYDMMSYDGTTVTLMNNLSPSSQTVWAPGTNSSYNFATIGALHRASGYLNRFQGDYAGDLIFTNSMSDGTSRTNVINAIDRIFHFIQ